MGSHEHETPQDQSNLDRLRPRLTALAYRMLGTTADAEDAVQDAFLRYQRHGGEVASPEAWLVRVTTRLCIDRMRRGERVTYVGDWLPEPVPENAGLAEDPAELAESLSTAFMVLLETLNPVERAAFLLRDVFGYDFDRVAEIIGKTPANARQIAVRARRRVGLGESRFPASPARSEALAETFFDACRSGDLAASKRCWPTTPRWCPTAAATPSRRRSRSPGGSRSPSCWPSPSARGGNPGGSRSCGSAVSRRRRSTPTNIPSSVVTLGVRAGSVGAIYVMRNPEKLRLWAANAADRDRPPPRRPTRTDARRRLTEPLPFSNRDRPVPHLRRFALPLAVVGGLPAVAEPRARPAVRRGCRPAGEARRDAARSGEGRGPRAAVRRTEGARRQTPRTSTMLEVTLDPLAGSPPHRHPGPISGYVLEGSFEFQVEGKPKRILKAGESFFEPEMILHLVGRNPDAEKRTRVLATMIHPTGAKNLVIPEPAGRRPRRRRRRRPIAEPTLSRNLAPGLDS